MRISLSALNGLSTLGAATSEVNKFDRPYPWYCSAIGWTGLSEECTPKSVEQINSEADAWLRQKVAEGKLSPQLAEQGIANSRKDIQNLCAEEPGACEMLDAYANSPKCAALLPASLCNALGSDSAFLLAASVLGIAGVLVLVSVLKK
jgi:hypothetical protein